MGKGSQDDFNDAKLWLEPEIEVARPGRTLKRHALGQALKVILDTFALGKWTINKTMRNFFNTMYRACVYTVDCRVTIVRVLNGASTDICSGANVGSRCELLLGT